MTTPKKHIKKRKKEYEEAIEEILPSFEHLKPKKAKKKHRSEFLK